MRDFVIIPDATCDLSEDLKKRFGIIDVVETGVIFPNGEVKNVHTTWEHITPNDFYNQLRKGASFKTSTPTPDKYIEKFEKYLKDGKDILAIILSSGLSSSYSYAMTAANELKDKYPEAKILICDSKRYSTAELLLLIRAYEYKKAGNSIEETFNKLETDKLHLHQSGPMDDLRYLARVGRISHAKAFMGQLIGVNPIGDINEEGKTTVLAKVKGSKKALKASIEYIKATIINPSEQIIVISHSDREEKANLFKEMIIKEIKPKEVIMTEVGLGCAPNIGPGLCGAYYYGKEFSKDLNEEKLIFEQIIKAKKES